MCDVVNEITALRSSRKKQCVDLRSSEEEMKNAFMRKLVTALLKYRLITRVKCTKEVAFALIILFKSITKANFTFQSRARPSKESKSITCPINTFKKYRQRKFRF